MENLSKSEENLTVKKGGYSRFLEGESSCRRQKTRTLGAHVEAHQSESQRGRA